jgi:hypothetical protein
MRRRLIALSLAMTSIAALAGCGGGGAGEANAVSVEAMQLAADNTEAAHSSRFVMSMDVVSGDEHVTIRTLGAASADGKRARVAVELAGNGQFEELIVDDQLYLKVDGLPGGNQRLPAGKHWVRIGFDDLAGQLGLDLDEFRNQARSGTHSLQYLEGLSGHVERVGDDTVNGEHATQYRASIDYSLAADKLPGLSGRVKYQLAELGTVPADVWIDDHDRVVKLHYAIDASAFGVPGSGSGTAELTMEIGGFDEPVDVQAPPADEVIDLSELVGVGSEGIPA